MKASVLEEWQAQKCLCGHLGKEHLYKNDGLFLRECLKFACDCKQFRIPGHTCADSDDTCPACNADVQTPESSPVLAINPPCDIPVLRTK